MSATNNSSAGMSRRRFVRSTAMGVALFNILPGSVVQGAPTLSPNEKLNVAGIGIGGRGGADVDEVAGLGHNIVALCDVDEKYAAKEFAKHPDAKRFTDYRVMLDKMGKEIDGVLIGTPDHTHALITLEAFGRGKHVYCEKPLAHSIYEIREVMAAAKKHKKLVTQLGNQGHSTDSIRRVCEWIWAGAVGNVHTVHAGCDAYKKMYCQIPNLARVDEHHDAPPGLNYDLWLGPVEDKPYSPLWVPVNWRGWMHFGSGCIGDWICHVLDPAYWALDLGAPASVMAEAPGFDPVKQGMCYPGAAKITFEFPANQSRGAVKVVWHDGDDAVPTPEGFPADEKIPGTGAVILGDKGSIVHGSHGAAGCHLLPEALMEKYSGKNAPAEKIPRVRGHAWDWAEAIKTGRKAGSDFEYGGPLSQVAMIGLIALRFPGQTLRWDEKHGRFSGNDDANKYIHPAFRKGWKV